MGAPTARQATMSKLRFMSGFARLHRLASVPAARTLNDVHTDLISHDPNAHLFALLHDHADALLVGHDHVQEAVPVDVGYDELGADPGVVVDLHRSELGHAVRRLARLEPIEHGRLVRSRFGP